MVHRSQLQRLGIRPWSIRQRVKRGGLHPALPSVFAVGYRTSEPLAAETAALLYAGDDAVLSHGTAAAFRHGFPVTAPARTLIDYAAWATDAEFDAALAEARVLGLVSDGELEAALARCPLRSGVRRVRARLAAERGPAITRSQAERLLRQLVDQAELPVPRYNAELHGFEVDALWSRERLVVEVDGYAAHGHRRAYERDSRRGQVLAAAGYLVVRVTWRQLTGEPMAVVARLAAALARGQPPAPE